MLDSDLIGPHAPFATDHDGAMSTAQNMRCASLRIVDAPSGDHTAIRVDQYVSGFSRAMGPIGFLSCLYIVGWMSLHFL